MISVCMATYNGGKYLREQIDSILKQISIQDELIISDDGSSDDTLNILKSYQDARIKVYHHHKIKQKYSFAYTTANFANALSYAQGDYIFLSDQDDVWIDGRVEKMLEQLKDYDVVVSDCEIVDGDLNILLPSKFCSEGIYTNIIKNIIKCTYLGCTMALKSSVLSYVLPFPKDVPHDLWIGLTVKFKGRIGILYAPTIKYRRHEHNVSATSAIVMKQNSRLPKNRNTWRFKFSYRGILVRECCKFLYKVVFAK